MAIQFHRAQRKKARLRLAIAGPAGSGKTYSALLIAFGLGGRTAMIDTERGSGELYAHLGDYDVCSLEAPFVPEKYVEAIRAAEGAGYDNIIIDSLSHAWAGPGGVLDIHGHAADRGGNSWTAWRQVTPRHNELVDAMLLSRCHIIATLRSKMEHVQTTENGKTVIKKVGMNPIQRDGMEYEFTTFWDLDHNHTASASKDRTGLFDGQVFKPVPETGGKLLQWLEAGVEAGARPGWQPNLVVVGGGQADGVNNGTGAPENAAGTNAGRGTGDVSPENHAGANVPDHAGGGGPENHVGFAADDNNGGGDSPAGCGSVVAGNQPGSRRTSIEQQKQAAGAGRQLHNIRATHAQNTAPSPAGPPVTGGQAPATRAQLRKIFATAGEAGLNETELSQIIEQETGQTSAQDLTKPEASRVIDLLLGMAQGQPGPQPEQAAPPSRAAGGGRMRLF